MISFPYFLLQSYTCTFLKSKLNIIFLIFTEHMPFCFVANAVMNIEGAFCIYSGLLKTKHKQKDYVLTKVVLIISKVVK